MHFSLPSSLDKDGNKKEIYWKYDGIQVPIVITPGGDGVTPQVPLDVRCVREEDFAYAESTLAPLTPPLHVFVAFLETRRIYFTRLK